ncbi:type IV secretion system DNA-binding domain-containing protein [Novosphingobium humi]|uniref:Type IV secretion system DNA-binding domain-containing protein n=1 Tax=Novosphingobium humi TaxID=2282397 RepID=A0ABY7TXJ4_9SPHN|nr:type IV secretion system DNA-binding domain-containing protein [Novosphingobium humi]WCT77751.1 type IV secretion system DNA-binding domain-containing protein [Novosphingobium humi]
MIGGQDFTTRAHALWRMRLSQYQHRLGFFAKLLAVMTLGGALVLSRLVLSTETFALALQCLFARGLVMTGNLLGHEPDMNVLVDGIRETMPASDVAYGADFASAYHWWLATMSIGAVMGVGLGIMAIKLLRRAMVDQGQDTMGDRVLSGTRVIGETELASITAPPQVGGELAIGAIPLPRRIETRHFAMLGTTGSGKTTALRQMLDGIERRGEPALVYDTSGEFIAHYYRPERGDIILNPFDARCAFWSPFDEISHPADADRIARQLVSDTSSQDDDVWMETSRILVANMLRSLWAEGNCRLEALLEALQVKSKDQLKQWLLHTSSARTFADDADRATGSVLFMLAKAANLIQFLRVDDGRAERFAFRDFVAGLDAREGAKPWIFVPRKEDYFEASKPLMACWLECAASAVLGLSPSPNRRIWFILDELADLPKVDNLARLLPEGRKFGAAIVLTFQALGQMRNRYGTNIAEAMLACCNTKLFLQTVDRETRAWASQTIGDCEVELRSSTDTLSFGADLPRTTLNTQRQFRPAVLESELRLEPHHGFLLLPDGLPVARIHLTADHIAARGSPRQLGFIPAPADATLWSRASQISRDARAAGQMQGPV